MGRPVSSLRESFAGKWMVHPRTRCWIWTGARFSTGYGQIAKRGKQLLAHRVSWVLHHGPLGANDVVCHSCDNPACVNPEHLFIGTQKTNMADCAAKHRSAHGERNGQHKLSEGQVLSIKESKESERALAARFGVCRSNIGYIRRGKRWSRLTA